MLRLYTDGACGAKHTTGHERGGWAFVVVDRGRVLHEESGASPNSTNNRMELMAVMKALEWVRDWTGIHYVVPEVVSDSQYVIRGITEWVPKWKADGWRRVRPGHGAAPVKNREHWERLDALVADVNPTFRWVKGHNGDRFNTKADRLARRAAHSGEILVAGQRSVLR